MKKATIEDARKAGACYSESELKAIFGKRKSFTPKQVLSLKIPDEDKIWALTRDHWLSHVDIVKFAVFCAEQVIEIYEQYNREDIRPRQAINSAKAFIENPTVENKNAAYAAYAAANAAACAAANAAACAACAAYAAANAAACAAYAAYAAAYAAYAAANAANAACAAAYAAARKAQLKFLAKLYGVKI